MKQNNSNKLLWPRTGVFQEIGINCMHCIRTKSSNSVICKYVLGTGVVLIGTFPGESQKLSWATQLALSLSFGVLSKFSTLKWTKWSKWWKWWKCSVWYGSGCPFPGITVTGLKCSSWQWRHGSRCPVPGIVQPQQSQILEMQYVAWQFDAHSQQSQPISLQTQCVSIYSGTPFPGISNPTVVNNLFFLLS